jgi:hypothetical protein
MQGKIANWSSPAAQKTIIIPEIFKLNFHFSGKLISLLYDNEINREKSRKTTQTIPCCWNYWSEAMRQNHHCQIAAKKGKV